MRVIFAILMAMLILSNCSPRVIPGPVYFYPKVEPIEIELKSFSFEPNHIAILTEQSPVTLHLKNTDGISHNFTLMAPDRNVILSQDLKPKESVTANIGFLNPENYVFYCFFHRHRGMEGMLMVD